MPKRKKRKHQERKKKIEGQSKFFAFLSVFLSILGFVIALLLKKNDGYVMFYAKQSLIIFLGFAVCSAIAVVPVIGWLVAPLMWALLVILWIVSMVFTLTGDKKETPLIGRFGREIKI